MKVVDISKLCIVDGGQSWTHSKKPCHKDMLPFLDQNESIVTWVCPKGKTGDVRSQFPVIRIHGRYYTISLRMMKIIWRHVKLAGGFVNRDLCKDGRPRLRIPEKLFAEKKRTQDRFNEMRTRTVPAQAEAPAKEAGINIHCKSYRLFCEQVLPLVAGREEAELPEATTFVFNEEEILASILSDVHHKCPELYKDRYAFLKAVEDIVYPAAAGTARDVSAHNPV